MQQLFWTLFGVFTGLITLAVLVFIAVFLIVFYNPNRTKKWLESYTTPFGKVYDEFRPFMIEGIKTLRATPHTNYEITSFDGLKLKGKYYECKPGAPIELMLHGYRGCAESDLSIGVVRAHKLGHNAFLVDHRGAGFSEGNVISFGVNESKDCFDWINLIIKTFGENQKIILTGISMGAATALLTAGRADLPKNVVGVIADCGYTSAEDIIKKIVRKLHLPEQFMYNVIKLGAKLFGRINLDEANVLEATKQIKVPVAFFHGETDSFVPAEMSKQNYNACNSKKYLSLIPNCEHGLAYVLGEEEYLKTLNLFLSDCGIK